jgi:radical SAM protein with 4Fe4S-binding SPASM domain
MLAKIFLEITNVCNLSCAFCPPTRRDASFMSPADFELFLDRIEGLGDHLYFHVKGEPLLHPSLGRFLEIAAARGFAVTLTTNGKLVADQAETLLGAASLRKLSISLHSHAGAPDLHRYWIGVEAFLDRHRERPSFPVSLRLWNRSSGCLPPGTEPLWALLRARYPAAGSWESASDQAGGLRLDDRVFLNQAEEYAWPSLSLPQLDSRGFCRGLRNQVAVLVDGTVVPCCMDAEGDIPLGSLRESGLRQILESPRARSIHEGFSRRELVEPLCRTCGYRRKFS